MPTTEPTAGKVTLRAVSEDDLPVFFEHQRDPAATRMAAFPARQRSAFMEHWSKILADDSVVTRTVLFEGEVAGNVVCFERSGRRLVGYWLGRKFWGRGVATRALSELLLEVAARPLHAWVAKHNHGSIRVLEKCGFTLSRASSVGVPTGDGVEELLYELVR